MLSKNVQEMMALLIAGTVQVTPLEEFQKKLEKGKKLIIKLGADPTAPDLHLGHAVVLEKMRQFQDLGHTVIFLIGDFTAHIGDPSGKSKVRPPIAPEQIALNMRTYFEQVGKVLDTDKIQIRYNSQWLGVLSSADMIKLCAKVTLARLTERDDFANRIAHNQPIGFHELLYPLLQGYDSVALQADVELGGTDQTFNLLVGRFLQEQYDQEPQVIMTMPLLVGLDGVHKMSKSLGNAVGLTEPANQAYGKLMSLPDDAMWSYFELLVHTPVAEIKKMQQSVERNEAHPMELKKQMAHAVVAKFWSVIDADDAQKQFESLFQKRDYSQAQSVQLPDGFENPIWIVDLLRQLGVIESSSQARRLIEDGAVTVDGKPIVDFKDRISWQQGSIVKAGKHHIYRIA